jgi:hypothetical protein
MQTLNMIHTVLQSFFVDIQHLTELSTIDLSGNKISSLEPDMISQLSAQALNLKNRTGKPLTIDLSRNALLCTCSVKHFADWVLDIPDNIVFVRFNEYTCLNDASSNVYFRRFKKLSDFACWSKEAYIGFGICLGIAVLFLIAVLVFLVKRYFVCIKYFYIIAKNKVCHKRIEEERNTNYDVFASYNENDQDWVEKVLAPKLENENIRVRLHVRDVPIGGHIPGLFLESIQTSRKTILILSPQFILSDSCQFEEKMALELCFTAGRDAVLLVILEPLDNVKLSYTMRGLMTLASCLKWTKDQHEQRNFWYKLIPALKNVPDRPASAGRSESEARNITDNEETRLLNPSTSAVQV